MIRQATMDDVSQIMALGERFHAQSPYADIIPYCADSFGDSLGGIIGGGAIFIGNDAFCGGIVSSLYFNRAASVCSELFWFAGTAGDGPKVFRAWSEWTKTQGVIGDHMTILCDGREPRMRNLLNKRHGYQAVEVSLFRRH